MADGDTKRLSAIIATCACALQDTFGCLASWMQIEVAKASAFG
jgi:hypothetical protein